MLTGACVIMGAVATTKFSAASPDHGLGNGRIIRAGQVLWLELYARATKLMTVLMFVVNTIGEL